MKHKKSVVLGSMLLSAIAFSGSAQAGLVDCGSSASPNLLGSVTSAADCQFVGTPSPSNVASISNINAAGFFGRNDWEMNGGQGQMGSSGGSGTWTIANADFSAFEYILVFKAGAGTNLTAFLLDGSTSTGSWSTPFVRAAFRLPGKSQAQGVSHISVAKRALPQAVPVPEPLPLALLGLGLAGLGAQRRMKKAS